VRIQDVIEIHGRRSPSSANSAKTHRQAFVYISSAGRTPDATQVAKIDSIRRAWEGFFFDATDRRMRLTTTLR
jgi:hypothetical protein